MEREADFDHMAQITMWKYPFVWWNVLQSPDNTEKLRWSVSQNTIRNVFEDYILI